MDSNEPIESNRCFICGYSNPHGLHEHHVVPREYGGTDRPENIVTLCASCHQAIHKLYDASFFDRLGVAESEGKSSEDAVGSGSVVDSSDSFDRDIPIGSPHVRFEAETGGTVMGFKFQWRGGRDADEEISRLHCGYCNTTFEPHQQAALARHLRISHGIDDVYESPSKQVHETDVL